MVGRKEIEKGLYGIGLFGDSLAELKAGKLAEDFTLPPLSVLSAREGWWQDRKRAWLALGIQSELGRGGDMTWGTGNDLDGYRNDVGMSKTASNPPTDESGALINDQYRGKRPLNSSLAYNRAAPGGSAMPAMNYKNRERGTGAGKAITGTAASQPATATPEVVRRPPIVRAQPPMQVQTLAPEPRAAAPQPLDPPAPERKAPPLVAATMPRRIGAPTIIVGNVKKKDDAVAKAVLPPAPESSLIKLAKTFSLDKPIPFDELTWDEQKPGTAAVGVDVECYANFFLVCLRRFDKTGKRIAFEKSDRATFNFGQEERLERILSSECLITFNGMSYDIPMLCLLLKGASLRELFQATQHIISTKMKYWDAERELNIRIPNWNHVDLKEPNPSVRQSLKTLNGRLHGKRLMDLPYSPDTVLSREQMNVVSLYCMESDLEGTQNLFHALREPLQLRQILGKRYGLDLRSKSDAQVGEAIVRKRIETKTRRTIKKSGEPFTGFFKYQVPPFINFTTPLLKSILSTIRNTEFTVNGGGHVNVPDSLANLNLTIGHTTYNMGIGGLHSTEGTRALLSDDENILVDIDVAGHYPATIVKLCEQLKLYPPAAGPAFTEEYGAMLHERNAAKRGAAAAKKAGDKAAELPLKAEADGGKIANNGVFGKLMSQFSFLYHPPLGLGTTITGQLSVLMLIEQAEEQGISAMSGNTDGVLFKCPRNKLDTLTAMLKKWEEDTGFEVETTYYKAVYSRDVNTYMAIKEDGTAKRKSIGNPWADGDLRGQLSKNPQMTICSDAVLALATKGTSLEQTIRSNADVRNFVTIIKVEGGSTWRDAYLGKVVRYYWSTQGEPIRYVSNKKKVAKTDGASPLMELPDTLPDDIDYNRYVLEATNLAYDIGVLVRPSVFNAGSTK